uniref:CCHC-type domain-containing protein n=1 Tax=Chenopodium quinoa TaxID=63459 RepID=A0A803LCG4_CHEQI
MAADKGEFKLEKFDGKDFGFWKMQIEDYLYQKKLYQPLEEKKPDGMQEAEWKLLDRQALGVIRLTLSRNVAFNIAKETTMAGLMKALSNMYEKPSASNKVHLMRRLFSLRMSEGGSVAQHLNELNSVTTQLSSVEIKFDDEVLALILLSSLPDSWNATVTTVSSSSGNNKLKFDDVQSRGRNLIRRNERGRSNYRGQSRDRRSKSRNPNNFQNSKTVECWNCGKIGHYKNQCKGTPKGKEVKAEANVTSTGEGDDALICSLESKEESWVLDSGASFHATSNKNFFEKYVHRNLGQVYLGDDQPCDIVGQGNVKIKLNGSAWELKDVKHVPDLRKNLISVGQLAREGSDMNDIIKLKHQLSKEFDMKDLGPAKKILGMRITRDKQRGTLQLSQSEYIKRVLQKFNMGDAKPEALYHYSSAFEVFDATLPRNAHERLLIESEMYGKEIINVVACEGVERVQRPETYKKWQEHSSRAGLQQVPLDRELVSKTKAMVKANYLKDFFVDEDKHWMLQGWKGRTFCALSLWKPC